MVLLLFCHQLSICTIGIHRYCAWGRPQGNLINIVRLHQLHPWHSRCRHVGRRFRDAGQPNLGHGPNTQEEPPVTVKSWKITGSFNPESYGCAVSGVHHREVSPHAARSSVSRRCVLAVFYMQCLKRILHQRVGVHADAISDWIIHDTK